MFLGIDVGSTAIKLGIVNTEGKLMSYFNSPYSTAAISGDHIAVSYTHLTLPTKA